MAAATDPVGLDHLTVVPATAPERGDTASPSDDDPDETTIDGSAQ